MFDWFFKPYAKIYGKVIPTLPAKVMLSIGLFMIAYGIFSGSLILDYNISIIKNYRLIAAALISVGGAYIIFDGDRNYISVTVIFAFCLGLYRSLFYFIGAIDAISADYSSSITILVIGECAYYVVMCIMGILLLITAAAITMGFSFRRNSLLTSCIIVIVEDLAIITVYIAVIESRETISIQVLAHSILELLLFFQVLWIFDSDVVRNRSDWGKHSWFMYNVRNSVVSDKISFVLPKIAEEIVDPEKKAWRKPMDCGPVELEYQFYIYGKGSNHNEVLFQKWKNDDRIHMTSCGNIYPSLLFANRQFVDSIYVSNGQIHLSGKGGLNISFDIRERRPQDFFGMDGDSHE